MLLLRDIAKLPGVGDIFSDVETVATKMHYDAGIGMLECMSTKDIDEVIVTKWCDVMAIHAQPVWSRDEYTGQQLVRVRHSLISPLKRTMFSRRLVMDILLHEASYVKQLVDIHEVGRVYLASILSHTFIQLFIKALENAPYPLKDLTNFLLSTVDGYSEMVLAHQELLRDLFEHQLAEFPSSDATYALESVVGCLMHLDDVYSDYFSDREDRRFVLAETRKEDERFNRFVEACIKLSLTTFLNLLTLQKLR